MSAPLVVNTADGMVWTRRAVTRGGIALYAPQDVCRCPEFVMATEAELAEHGIVGSADALPMPAGPEFDPVEELIGASLARFEEELENARLRLALASAQRGRRELRARVAELEAERHSTNEALSDAAEQLRADRDRHAELEAWKAADEQVRPHREASATAAMHRTAHLELRLRRVRFVHTKHADSQHCQHDGEPWPCPTLAALDAPVGEVCHPCGCPKRFIRHADGCPTLVSESADKLTALFAPTQVLGDDARQLTECSVCRAPREDWCPDCGVCASNCYGLRDSAKCQHARAPWAVRDA